MTILVSMSGDVYTDYIEDAVSGYARDNVESGRWPEDGALARSQKSFDSSLPQGLHTPDNYLFEIKAEENGQTVGFIWFAVVENNGLRSAFVYDIEIRPEFRRQGHAEAAFKLLETCVKELGLSSIGLHVFAYNSGAQALYDKLGYDVTSINMHKKLGGNSD